MTYGAPIPRCPQFDSTYLKGCRCAFCRTESGRRMNAYRARKAAGLVDVLVPGDPARRAIRTAMRTKGVTRRQVIELSGVSSAAIYELLHTRNPRIRRSVEDKILNAMKDPTHEGLSPDTFVTVKRSAQLIRSMCVQGWSKAHQQELIARHTGMNGGFVFSATAKAATQTRYRNEQALEWLAKQIGDKVGPSEMSTRNCSALGFFPLKHYNVKGDLIESTLSDEQRRVL